MAEARKKKSFFAGVKTEFSKITWPEIPDVLKQTAAVVVVSLLAGAFIAVVDLLAVNGLKGLDSLVGLIG